MAKFNASLVVKGGISAKDFHYQNPVEAIQTDATLDPGATPTLGDRYIITNAAALNANFGSITGLEDDDIVQFDGTNFVVFFDASLVGEGAVAWSKADNAVYQFDGTGWGTAANPDGGDGVTFNGGSNRYDLDLAASSGLELTASDGSGQLQIAASGVTEARIANDAVTADKIAAGAVGSSEIATDAVGSDELADNAVDTAAIQAGAVTDAKVASGIDAAKIGTGSVDNTEFGHLDGVTSAIQTQLDAKQALSEKNAANGYAGLDANGLIASSQIPDIAVTSVTTVADITARDALTTGTGQGEIGEGDVVIVTDASADPAVVSGAASYIYTGSTYVLLRDGDDVLSVNGSTGVVTVNAINELTGDVTAGPASGSQSAAATISALAVTEGKIADDAVTSAKIATDAVGTDALDIAGTSLRSGALTDPFTASLTRTFTHNWGTTDVMVEVQDATTGETCFVDAIVRTSNAVAITVSEVPENSLRVMIRELSGSQTVLVVS